MVSSQMIAPLFDKIDSLTPLARRYTEFSGFTSRTSLFHTPPALAERIDVLDGTLGYLIEHTHRIVARWPALCF